MDLLHTLSTRTEHSECPPKYIQWAGLCALSAAIGRRAHIKKSGLLKIYPNIFVIIVSETASMKSFAVSVTERLLEPIPWIRAISGRISIEAALYALGKPHLDPKGGNNLGATGILVSGELTNLLISADYATTILTELYDAGYKNTWKNATKNSGTDSLERVCLSLFGATTAEHFTKYFTDEDILGGFLGRVLLVSAPRRGDKFLNPGLDDDIPEIDFSDMTAQLNDLGRIDDGAQFKLVPGAKSIYDDWYREFYAETAVKERGDNTGFAGRARDHVLKIAMLLSLSRSCGLSISQQDIERAIELVFSSSRNLKKLLFGRSGQSISSPVSSMYKIVLEVLIKAGGSLPRQRLLQKLYGSVDAFDLDRVARGMVESGFVKEDGNSLVVRQDILNRYYELSKKEAND